MVGKYSIFPLQPMKTDEYHLLLLIAMDPINPGELSHIDQSYIKGQYQPKIVFIEFEL